ncbi:hypothetical protein FAF44_05280 [Nonomuraea sp. MG754425]|uniref:glycine cleavage system protein H n=1 Tax=Nonomuraea sp. MG754425 TaxID=2570319 RepID=UPI001F1C300E|nr:hypothetical protein [Nonomuraea sp. MG754425]MCF6467823.1 hypothetical protein [Nonomuraea sp. MG754425]
MSEYPDDRLYSEMNVWGNGWYADDDYSLNPGDRVKVGFTSVVQQVAGGKANLVIELPAVNSTPNVGDSLGYLGWGYESDDDYNDEGFPIGMPVDGMITAVNTRLADSPELALDDPYGEGWLFELEVTKYDPATDLLMEADDYAAYIAQFQDS